MKFVFFGTPEFAAVVLGKLVSAGFIPEAVVCNPDRPVGRKKIITPPAVKQLIANGKLPIEILQPENINTISDKLSDIRPDVFIVAAYAKILPKEIIGIPKLGTIGVHPSLLPKYRGASPIQSAILSGEKETGVTLYLLDEKMDNGPILANSKWLIANGTDYETLEKKLAEMGGDLLAETLPKFTAGEITPKPQNDSEATFTKKFSTQDGFVDEKELEKALSGGNPETAGAIYRKILALTPEPGVWTLKDGKRVKLLKAELKDDKLVLKVVQTEGQKPIRV